MALDGPVCSISCGVPVTTTDSLKFTVRSRVSPAVKNPSFKLDEIETTVGTDPFTDIFLLSDKEFPEPTSGRVKKALFPAESRILPPLTLKGFVV